ncbi:mitotic apparatus protein p62-like [Helianthus annuus]|uniref:mitotic apparatus protein p62-like n=1 Tax=Helianthus annuus TaxID=4232 RepID=UPI000B908C89|nr:mitotic apparatus protein p62-like [Helianthus annuus]
MILYDKIKNLAKDEKDELLLEHMTNATLDRLQVYKKKSVPLARLKFACIQNPDYFPPPEGKWCYDDSDLGNEEKKMEDFEPKCCKWFIKEEGKKKKSKKGTPKKVAAKKLVQRALIDERKIAREIEAEDFWGDENIEGGTENVEDDECTSSPRSTNLEDVPDMPFFDDGRMKVREDKVEKLPKEKAATDDKVKDLEAQNVFKLIGETQRLAEIARRRKKDGENDEDEEDDDVFKDLDDPTIHPKDNNDDNDDDDDQGGGNAF